MRLVFVLAAAAALISCEDSEPEPIDGPEYDAALNASALPEMVSTNENLNGPEPSPELSRPAHNYDARDGLFYSYFAAISEDDRKAGKAARDVVTFAYLGMRGSTHVLAQVRPNRSVIGESYCNDPCKVITYSDGGQAAYSEDSIIGAAFADAIAGRLEVAQYNRPSTPLISQPAPTPAAQSAGEPNWTEQEAVLISKWIAADQACRFGTSVVERDDGCANRDGIYSASLSQAGICTTRNTRFGIKQSMHRCDENSVR